MIVGDLNISLSLNEKKGGLRGRDFMLGFVEEIISTWYLNDLNQSPADSLGPTIEQVLQIYQPDLIDFLSAVL